MRSARAAGRCCSNRSGGSVRCESPELAQILPSIVCSGSAGRASARAPAGCPATGGSHHGNREPRFQEAAGCPPRGGPIGLTFPGGSGSVAQVQLALRLEFFRTARLEVPFDLIRRAEDLGFHSVWTAEAYGADAMTPLAAIATATQRIKLGTAVVQLAGRPPAMLGMQAMTVDALAGGGRMIVGVGLSGPQIVEGWYGQPWGKPNARLRDYVEILRDVLRREGPVTHDGREISLPYNGPGALGQGKPLKS